MKHLIFLAISADNYLQNPVAPATSYAAMIDHFVNHHFIPLMVPFIAISLIITGLKILKGRTIYKRTGDKTYLNKAAISSLYVMLGAALVVGSLVHYYWIGPWLIAYFGTLSELLFFLFFIGVSIIYVPSIIEKKAKNLFSFLMFEEILQTAS